MRNITFTFFSFAILGLLAGCSSTNNALTTSTSAVKPIAATGQFRITFHWPTRSTRLIPVLTNHIDVALTSPTIPSLNMTQTVSRPPSGGESDLNFAAVPVGNVKVTVNAYYNDSGNSNHLLASAVTMVTVVFNQTASAIITMNSTITQIAFNPGSTSVPQGQTAQEIATPKNGAFDVIPLPTNDLEWFSESPNIATVDSNGVVTGVAVGQAVIDVTERESGVQGKTTITVTPGTGDVSVVIANIPVSVSVTPGTVTLAPGAGQQFTANVANSPDTLVRWSVQETDGGGTIDVNGKYTAPSLPGTYHVVATSVADPTKTGVAVVTVPAT